MIAGAAGMAAAHAVGATQVELRGRAELLQMARIMAVVDIARRMTSFDALTVGEGIARVTTTELLAVHYSFSSASQDFVNHSLATWRRHRCLARLAHSLSLLSVSLTISRLLHSRDVPDERQTRQGDLRIPPSQ